MSHKIQEHPITPHAAFTDAEVCLFPLEEDQTAYDKLTGDYVESLSVRGEEFLFVHREGLQLLAKTALEEINHYLRPGHLQQLRSILEDPEATRNDRFVAHTLLKNANVAAGGVLPMCQDTGTVIVIGKKGRRILTDGHDVAALSEGIAEAYLTKNFRYSHLAPLSMFEEVNTGTNLPAQIDLYAQGDESYKFLFMAKGGGSANKTFFYQSTVSVLTPARLLAFIKEKLFTLGTSACPPYHLAVVIGGLSAEMTIKTVKLASARYLDALPSEGSKRGYAFRDRALEAEIHKLTQNLGIGAQFGGKYFCHDVRVIRLPRHSASLPIGIGVSCSADRQALAKITKEGIFLERLEKDPQRFLPEIDESTLSGEVVAVDLNRPMAEILRQLSQYPICTRLSLTGPLIVARDLVHARLRERLEAGEKLPEYFKSHPIYYAGPAKTPAGMPSGSFGPTTAGRMDSYIPQFQAAGGSMVMLAKGNRSDTVRQSCQKYGGFYLGSIGGPAALIAQESIKKVEVLDFEEFGMEAVWRIEVENFPAFIITDDKGNDFFRMIEEKEQS